MTGLDAALLELTTACRVTLPHRPRRDQVAVERAIAAVIRAAREASEGPRVTAQEELRQALERAAVELGWSETMVTVNAMGRRYAGPVRRAAE